MDAAREKEQRLKGELDALKKSTKVATREWEVRAIEKDKLLAESQTRLAKLKNQLAQVEDLLRAAKEKARGAKATVASTTSRAVEE